MMDYWPFYVTKIFIKKTEKIKRDTPTYYMYGTADMESL